MFNYNYLLTICYSYSLTICTCLLIDLFLMQDKMLCSNINDQIHDIILEDNEEDHIFKRSGNTMKENITIHMDKNISRNTPGNSDEDIKEYDERIAENNVEKSDEENAETHNEDVDHKLVDSCIGGKTEETTTQTEDDYIKLNNVFFRK